MLQDILKRLGDGEVVKPSSQEEKDCFRILSGLDHIGGKVSGSITAKKHQRQEIWSLTAYEGAPAWHLTVSPPDSKNPLCLYLASDDEQFEVKMLEGNVRLRRVANNPVACARFFHFMIELFIKHILGVNTDHPGLYGKTSAYYGTVEQQGRLTLHLHILVWIAGSPSPDEIRKRLMDPTSDFQHLLIKYLESTHIGKFLTGTKDDVLDQLSINATKKDYIDPTDVLPSPPPDPCKENCKLESCSPCQNLSEWWSFFKFTVDRIVALSNIHTCFSTKKKDGTQDKRRPFLGCLDNVWNKCKACFPHPIFPESSVDPVTGVLNVKKLEPMINTISPVISYVFRGNTDSMNLRSGTALKGVILYITDYITKMALKTHTMFDVIQTIFKDNVAILGGSESRREKT